MSLVGFRFRPTVKELIGVLEIMAHGGDKVDVSQLTETPGDISDKQLYGEDDNEPWKLLSNPNVWELYDVADTGRKQATYVVTRLPKMGDHKVARKAGKGTWMGQTQPTVFEKDGEEVACMKSLSYVYNGSSSEAEDKCYYYMHEYYLSRSYLEKIGAKFTDYVICRIIKDTSKNCRCVRNGNNKRRRVDNFASSSGTKKEEENYNPNVISETLVYQEPPVYYNFPEFTGNPSSLGLCTNDHNLEVQDSHCNMVFAENLNPSGLWVDGYTPEAHPYCGSTIVEQQQQHHQDSEGTSVAQEPPSLYEGGISLDDFNYQEPPSLYGGGISLEDLFRDQDYGSANVGDQPQQGWSNAPAAIADAEASCVNQFGHMTDEESNCYMNQLFVNGAGEVLNWV